MLANKERGRIEVMWIAYDESVCQNVASLVAAGGRTESGRLLSTGSYIGED